VVNAYNTTALDVVMGNPGPNTTTVSEYATIMLDRLNKAHDLARERLKKMCREVQKNYDPRVKVKEYNVGDRVWVCNPRNFKGRSPKWEIKYKGPFEIIKRLNDVNYVIQRGPGAKQAVIHIDKLKPMYYNVVCFVCAQMFDCPECDRRGPSFRAMQRHCLGVHERRWEGPGVPLGHIPPDELPAAMEHLRKLRQNSTRRRNEKSRLATTQSRTGTATSTTHDEAQLLQITAGVSGSCLSLEMPKLAFEHAGDWDTDSDPSIPQKTTTTEKKMAATMSDAAVGDARATTADAATDLNDAVRLGRPADVDPVVLVRTLMQSLDVPASVLAHHLTPRPCDPDKPWLTWPTPSPSVKA